MDKTVTRISATTSLSFVGLTFLFYFARFTANGALVPVTLYRKYIFNKVSKVCLITRGGGNFVLYMIWSPKFRQVFLSLFGKELKNNSVRSSQKQSLNCWRNPYHWNVLTRRRRISSQTFSHIRCDKKIAILLSSVLHKSTQPTHVSKFWFFTVVIAIVIAAVFSRTQLWDTFIDSGLQS